MRTLSIRILADLAFERGEEFEPAELATPALVEQLSLASAAMPLVPAPGPLRAPPPAAA